MNSVRQHVLQGVRHIGSRVMAIFCKGERPQITLASGETLNPLRMFMVTGLHPGLRDMLDIRHDTLSPCHTISIGFDMQPEVSQL
jgi:hypothetical protein